MSMDWAEPDEKDANAVAALTKKDRKDAVEDFALVMKNVVYPLLQKEAPEKYQEVVYKFDMLENELHMRKKEENLEEGIDKLEKVREEVEATYLKIERTKDAVERAAQVVQENRDDVVAVFRACQRMRVNRDAREHE